MKNRKYKFKNLTIGAAATISVVAPVATLVACGANEKLIVDIKETGVLSDTNNGTAGLDAVSDAAAISTELKGILHNVETIISQENGVDKVYNTTFINELASSMNGKKTPSDLGIILPIIDPNIDIVVTQVQADDLKGELLAKLELTIKKGTITEKTDSTIKVVGYKLSTIQQPVVQQTTQQVIVQLTPEQRIEKFAAESTAKYSRQSLMNEAKLYNDNTTWNRGVAYHSMGAAVSFMKSLAESYGWKRSDFAQKSHTIVIDQSNEDKTDIVPSSSNIINQVNALRMLRADSTQTDATKRAMYFEVGDNDGGLGNDFYSVGLETFGIKKPNYDYSINAPLDYKNAPITWTGYPNTDIHSFKNQLGSDFTVETSDIFSYADAKTPGQMNVSIIDHKDNIERIVSVPDAFDKYPILSDEHLKNNIQPFLESLISKFVNVFRNVGSMANDYVPEETRDQLRFLVEKNTITDPNDSSKNIFKVDSNDFFNKLKELNNGSQHWLALKAYYLGLDTSLGNKYNYYDVGTWPVTARFASDSELTGVNEMSGALGFAKWAHWNRLSLADLLPENQRTASLKAQRINFIATKSDQELDDLYKAIVDDFKTEDFIRQYSVELNGIQTAGKTLPELRSIVFNQIINDSNNKQAIANIKSYRGASYVETISLDDLKAQIVAEKNNIDSLTKLAPLVDFNNHSSDSPFITEPSWMNRFMLFKSIFYSQFTKDEAIRLQPDHGIIVPEDNGYITHGIQIIKNQARESEYLTLPTALINQMLPGYVLNVFSYHSSTPQYDSINHQIHMTRLYSMIDKIRDNNYPGAGIIDGYDHEDHLKLHFVRKDEQNKLALFYLEIPVSYGNPKTRVVDLWFKYDNITYKDHA